MSLSKQQQVARHFKRVRKAVTKNMSAHDVDLVLTELESIVKNTMESYIQAIEVGKKECCVLEDRFVEVVDSTTQNHRLTVNANTGRITLKVGQGASIKVHEDLMEMAQQIRRMEDLPPLTLRGKIKWRNDQYEGMLYSDSKKFKQRVSYIP